MKYRTETFVVKIDTIEIHDQVILAEFRCFLRFEKAQHVAVVCLIVVTELLIADVTPSDAYPSLFQIKMLTE